MKPRYRWVEVLGAWRNVAWDNHIDSGPLTAAHRCCPMFLWPKYKPLLPRGFLGKFHPGMFPQ